MILSKAATIADYWKAVFEPYCRKIEIAGSIRRQKPEVKDIELICVPEEVTAPDLFSNDIVYRSPAFVDVFREAVEIGDFEILMGNPQSGKYVKVRLLKSDINMDVFIVTEENWGFQFAIRTGSGDYSHHVLGKAWSARGYHGNGGYMFKGPIRIKTPDEKEFFEMIGVPYTEPKDREYVVNAKS